MNIYIYSFIHSFIHLFIIIKTDYLITFNDSFNGQLEDSLTNYTDIEELIFNRLFYRPLGNSLSNLTNLKKLTFGYIYNLQLEDS